MGKGDIPLLYAVETRQGRNGDKDDNSLLAVADFNLDTIKNQHASSRFPSMKKKKQWTATRPSEIPTTRLMYVTPSTSKTHYIVCISSMM